VCQAYVPNGLVCMNVTVLTFYSEFILFYDLGTGESTFIASLFHETHSYLVLPLAVLGVMPKRSDAQTHYLSLILGITPTAHCGRSYELGPGHISHGTASAPTSAPSIER